MTRATSEAAVLTRAVLRLSRVVEAELKVHGLSPGQYRLLAQLGSGASTASAVATQLAIRPPTFSGMADGLVQRGLAARHVDEEDRRRITYSLTPEGRTLISRAESAVSRRLSHISLELGDEAPHARAALMKWHDAIGRATGRAWRRRRAARRETANE